MKINRALAINYHQLDHVAGIALRLPMTYTAAVNNDATDKRSRFH